MRTNYRRLGRLGTLKTVLGEGEVFFFGPNVSSAGRVLASNTDLFLWLVRSYKENTSNTRTAKDEVLRRDGKLRILLGIL